MIRYYKKHGEIFEINDKWDFYCNKALHEHYKSILNDFNNIKYIECGSGGGYESALMAKDGAKVTVLDYSSKAIEYARIVAQRNGVVDRIKFINSDIFNFSTKEEYDLAWNCGVIEHYPDDRIIQIIKKMASFVKKEGLIVVTVPNLLSPQSIYWMSTTGKSSERYVTHRKLKTLMKNAGLFQIQIKNFNYWLPSFLPVKLAIITSKIKFLNNLKLLCWLFSGIGIKK